MEETKKTVEEFFYFFDSDIKVSFSLKERSFSIDIKMKEPQILIGEKGQTLSEIERLLKIIIRKKSEEPIFINLDINNYKKRKEDYLRELALDVADEVILTGVEKKFPPMNSFERRIIHITLAKKENIFTESVGDGEERRVVIKRKK